VKFHCRKWLCPSTEKEVDVVGFDDDPDHARLCAAMNYTDRFMLLAEDSLVFIEVLTDPPEIVRVTQSSFLGLIPYKAAAPVSEDQARAECEARGDAGERIDLRPEKLS
jgi:hypothetical protein